MLGYNGWGNQSTMMLTLEDQPGTDQETDPTQQIFDPNNHHSFLDEQPLLRLPPPESFSTVDNHQNAFGYNNVDQTAAPYQPNFTSFHSSHYVDPRAYNGESSYAPNSSGGAFFSIDGSGSGSGGYYLLPKTEDVVDSRPLDFAGGNSRIGLNLGGRTYFSAADDDFINRLYRRSCHVEQGGGYSGGGGAGSSVSSPRCQAEGCGADLTDAKRYHRRHKVCDFHSKAPTVMAAGLTQRFCQQCSRFHLLSEFDNMKRSCRKRLADHNRRRRKSHQTAVQDNHKHRSEFNSCNTTPRSSQDSGAHTPSYSSVAVPVSPLRISLDSFGQKHYETTPFSFSPSSSSFFFSSG